MRLFHDVYRTFFICLLAMLVVLAAPVPADGQLVANWQMDESEWSGAAGEVTDASGSGNNGTARGQDTVPTTVDGQVCRAGDFRGQGFNLPGPPWYVNAQHFVEIPDAGSLSPLASSQQAMTIGGWFRPRTLDGTLIHKGEGGATQEYQVYIQSGRLSLRLWNRFGSPVTARISDELLDVDTWYFFSVSIERLGNSPNMRSIGYLYDTAGAIGGPRDEVLQSLRYNNKPLDGNVFIGGISYGGQPVDFYDGLLDELRIYSSVRTQAEIEAHRATTRPCSGPNQLIVEYRMEQAEWTGTTDEVADSSGNDRDATSVGGADTAVIDPALPGNPGTCRYGEFDGIDDGVNQQGAWLEGLSAITVMAWTYNSAPLSGNERGLFFTSPTGPGRDNRLGLRYDNAGFFGGGTNVIKASVSTTACPDNDECVQIETTSGLMVRDQWQHLAMTWEAGGDLKVFVDGVQASTTAEQGQGTGGVIDAVSALNIGQGAKGQRWQGRLDEFRIFEGALTESEIQTWRDTTAPCEVQQPHHIRLLHPGSGLTCQPADITVQACVDAGCSELFGQEVTVSLTSPAARWAPNPVSFTGQAIVALQVTSPGLVNLDATASPPAISSTRCLGGPSYNPCEMEWLDTGFVIDAPDHVSAVTQSVSVAAVRSDDDTQDCAAAFGNESRIVAFGGRYLNPGSGTLPLIVEGVPVPNGPPAEPIELNFDSNGVALVNLRYDDVGMMLLSARFDGSGDEAGLVMTGQDSFVVRPATFTLDIPDNPAAAGAGGPAFAVAGAAFPIETQARNAVGALTPNFGRESPPEGVEPINVLVAPVGGNNPPLTGAFGNFGEDCDGNGADAGTACGDFSWPEVGIVEIVPRLASRAYLGTADVTGATSGPVGRFIPSHFNLSAGSLSDRVELTGCGDDFTYMGELFGADWTLGAQNAGGITTGNYEGGFSKLGADALGIAGDQPITVDFYSLNWTDGFGTATARISADRSAPVEPHEAFRVGIAPIDSDGVELAVLDIDLSADGNNDHGLVGTTELRFGRIELDNAIGSELGPLSLPLRAEYFDESTWKINTLDECTALSLSSNVELTSSNGDTENGAASVGIGSGSTSIQQSDPITLSGGKTGFTFSAPGSTGWVDLTLLLDLDWHFLRNDLDDDGNFLENPSARASFGLFEGNENRILLQEVLPQ